MTRTIILSGFKTYGSHKANSSELTVRRLADSQLNTFNIIGKVFEATIPDYDRGEELYLLARRTRALGIISLGMGSERKGFRVEREARNIISHPEYVPAALNGKPIDDSFPLNKTLEVDLKKWNAFVFAQKCGINRIPVEHDSRDAGGFCCNHLMWQLRLAHDRFRHNVDIPFIYMHIPCTPECVSDPEAFKQQGKVTMSLTQIEQGLGFLLTNSKLLMM